MKKLICMVMVLALVLIAPLSVGLAAGSPYGASPDKTIHYLALGDSIAAGTDNVSIQNAIKAVIAKYPQITLKQCPAVLADFVKLQANPGKYLKGNSFRYTYQFRDYLKTRGTVSMSDWSVSGYTSKQLLNQLKRLTPKKLKILLHAEYITISIGGNDILPAGADSGFSKVDSALLAKNVAAYKANLAAALKLIKKLCPKATVILMNFFNLYHPAEMSTDAQYLYQQVDALLNPVSGSLGVWLKSLPAQYPNLKIADTYSLFDTVNKAAGATGISTGNTSAAASGPVFPARFAISADTSVVLAPHASEDSWNNYVHEWTRFISDSSAVPVTTGVAFDSYIQFYNPNNYVFGYNEPTSELYQLVKSKCNAAAWLLMKPVLDEYIGNYSTWRDVHCTLLGHSLIARANIDALN